MTLWSVVVIHFTTVWPLVSRRVAVASVERKYVPVDSVAAAISCSLH